MSAPSATQREASAPANTNNRRLGKFAVFGSAGLLLFKFKSILLLALGKGKLLVLGLLQLKTFASMALSLFAYSLAWGWQYALGIIVSIYVHEMGHVAWLRRYGIAATAPMFVPGVGAFVRLRQQPQSPAVDARIGLGGPLWGLFAAWGFLAVGWAHSWKLGIAISATGAWINLLNLLPIWQLDGSRAFTALTRRQRWTVALVFAIMALWAEDGLLVVLAVVSAIRAAVGCAPRTPDRGVLVWCVLLAILLTATGKMTRQLLSLA